MDTRSADNTLLEKTSPATSRAILFQPHARRADPRTNDEKRRLRDFVAEHALARIILIMTIACATTLGRVVMRYRMESRSAFSGIVTLSNGRRE